MNKNEVINPPSLKVFPNPARTFFIIGYDLRDFDQPGIVLITDQNGKSVKDIFLPDKQNQIIVPKNSFSSGVYLIQLFNENKLIGVEKMILQ